MRIAVIGAGPGGLAAAAALTQAGLRCEVFERRTRLDAGDGGIQISPNGAAALRTLGVTDLPGAVRPAAVELRRWRDGRPLGRAPLGASVEERYGAPYRTLHRASLHAALLAAASVPVHAGRTVVGVSDGGVTFADGGRVAADLVIGADGVHSAVRAALGLPAPRHLGDAYRAVVPVALLPEGLVRPHRVQVWLGPGQHCVCYPIDGGRLMNVVAVTGTAIGRDAVPGGTAIGGVAAAGDAATDGAVPGGAAAGLAADAAVPGGPTAGPATDAAAAGGPTADAATGGPWFGRGAVIAGIPADVVLAAFDGWCTPVRALLTAAGSFTRRPLLDAPPAPGFRHGRVVLLGDAAHPTLPFLAQGASQAIEDAVALAARLRATDDLDTALDDYDRVRRPRAQQVHDAVRAAARDHHLPDGFRQRRRDRRLATPPDRAWLYGHTDLLTTAGPR